MKQHEVSGKLDGEYSIPIASSTGPLKVFKRLWAVVEIDGGGTGWTFHFRVDIGPECVTTQNLAAAVRMYDSGVLNHAAGLPRKKPVLGGSFAHPVAPQFQGPEDYE